MEDFTKDILIIMWESLVDDYTKSSERVKSMFQDFISNNTKHNMLQMKDLFEIAIKEIIEKEYNFHIEAYLCSNMINDLRNKLSNLKVEEWKKDNRERNKKRKRILEE